MSSNNTLHSRSIFSLASPMEGYMLFFADCETKQIYSLSVQTEKKMKMFAIERLFTYPPVFTNYVILLIFFPSGCPCFHEGFWWVMPCTYSSFCLTVTDYVYFSFIGIRFRLHFTRSHCQISDMLPFLAVQTFQGYHF